MLPANGALRIVAGRQSPAVAYFGVRNSIGVKDITPLDDKIRHEQVRLIYNQGPVLVFGATLCAVLVTLFLWRHVAHLPLLIWLSAVCVSTVLRIWVIRSYRRASVAVQHNRQWGRYFWLGTLSAGLIWGVWPFLFYHLYTTEYLLLISTIFAGMVAVSAASASIFLPAFVSFSVPLILPLALTHVLSGIESMVLTGVLLIVFLIINGFLAARGSLHHKELIRARFENQELMERLETEKTIAQKAVIAKSRFLAAASHDLRQPLHAMGLFLSALRNREADTKQLTIIDDMTKSAQALNGLFNSLLDVSRLDAEIIEFNPTHVSVVELFDRLRAQFNHQAQEKNLTLIVDAKNCVLYSDSILLERILRNLLANAIQYTHRGRVILSCEAQDNGSGLISLTDTGIGIPDDELDEVFSEYYQLSNSERNRQKGLGLGLAIVKRLCELMAIPMRIRSELGQGTVFELDVPEGDSALVEKPPTNAEPVSVAGRRVLVIDDEPQVLQSMKHMLEDWGCQVLLAESARNALQIIALSDELPDLIFSDYRLANNLNGVDAVAAVRESLDADIPAIIVTGDTSPERLKEVSASDLQLLHKPVSADELHRVLSQLLAAIKPASQSADAPVVVCL